MTDLLCRLAVDEDGDTLVARVTGEIDLSNAALVGEEIRSRVANHSLGVVVDLSGLTYIDSAGLEVLFDLRRRLESRRQELTIAVPAESPVYRTLALVDLIERRDDLGGGQELTDEPGGRLRAL
jgi:anti-anti-sigma factor